MKYLHKALEFGFSVTVLSTVLLTACGGGNGNTVASVASVASTVSAVSTVNAVSTVSAVGTSVTVTPVKGKFQGSCTVSVMNASGVVVPNTVQAINANGTTNITLPAGVSGPYLVSISGAAGNTCQYFNDDYANPQWLTLLPTQSLNALLTSNEITSASGVAITAITEMAFQVASAVNGGTISGITDTSVALHEGRAAAVTLTGLTGASAVASIFTPPAVIPASGAAPTDDMGRTLVNIANLNGANPINAVSLMSLYATSAILSTTASGVPASYASAVAALPMSHVGQGAAFASRLAVTIPILKASAASISFFAELTTTGMRTFIPGRVSPVWSLPAMGYLTTGTLSNGIYTITRTWNHLINGVWTPANSGYYILGNAGWIDSNALPMTMTLNPDGSVRKTLQGYAAEDVVISKRNLTGFPIASAVAGVNANGQWSYSAIGLPMPITIPSVGAYTSGAVYFDYPTGNFSRQIVMQDLYEIDTGSIVGIVSGIDLAVTASGVPLTTLPTIGTPFCGAYGTYYYRPGVTIGTYDVFSTFKCATPLATAIPVQTVTASTVTVNGITLIELTPPARGTAAGIVNFLAVINGKVYEGLKTPKGGLINHLQGGTLNTSLGATGAVANIGYYSSAATQQQLNAIRLPMF